MRQRFAIAVALLLICVPSQGQQLSLTDFLEVGGQVRATAASPIANALVIAFSLSDNLNLKTITGKEGKFELPPLPVGVYRVVAVKRGFLPAVVTITPTMKDHKIEIELEEQSTASEDQKADAWTIRRSLPKDVLRELDTILGSGPLERTTDQDIARFAGSMESVAGYSDATDRSLEKTSVALRSDVGGWGVDFSGSRQLIDQAGGTSDQAEAADIALEVRSSPSNVYRVTSTRASWSQPARAQASAAGVETHSIAWHGRLSSVQVRYLSHENLFAGPGLDIEDTLELAGNALLYRGRRSDLGVSIRLKQDSMQGAPSVESLDQRYADLATNGSFVVTDGLGLEYGVATRFGDTIEFMPQSAAELRLGDRARLKVAGAYKFTATPDQIESAPGIAYLGQFPTMDTRYKYSVTVSTALGDRAGVSASARRSAADALTFLLFDDQFDEFWDGLYLHKGEVLTDGILSIQAGMGPAFQIAVITSAGRVDSATAGFENKSYVSGEVRTHYEQSGTSLNVSYRLLEQPDLVDEEMLREIERLSVVIGQSLHLPVDIRVLLGFSVANEEETLAAVSDTTRSQKRVMGGFSFSF